MVDLYAGDPSGTKQRVADAGLAWRVHLRNRAVQFRRRDTQAISWTLAVDYLLFDRVSAGGEHYVEAILNRESKSHYPCLNAVSEAA